MGSPPPVNNPPPDTSTTSQDKFATPGPPVASLCGFTVPSLPNFSPGFSLPTDALGIPPQLPIPKLPFGIDCGSHNPQDASKGVAYGGGRTPNADPSPDLDENNQ